MVRVGKMMWFLAKRKFGVRVECAEVGWLGTVWAVNYMHGPLEIGIATQ